MFFFFQAEDGIRDVAVTGVQTCALPISGRATPAAHRDAPGHAHWRTAASDGTAATRSPRTAGRPPGSRCTPPAGRGPAAADSTAAVPGNSPGPCEGRGP